MEQAVARDLSIESFQPSSLDSSFYIAVERDQVHHIYILICTM